MRSVSILGSTGSIGTQALEVIALFPDRFRIFGLSARANWELLAKQALDFRPQVVHLADPRRLDDLRDALAGTDIRLASTEPDLAEIASSDEVDLVVAAMVGFAGLRPVLDAVTAGKQLALANKETLVVGGDLVTRLAKANGAEILPVDSEHSAIFQCLVGEPALSVESVTLTASGGPFRRLPAAEFERITPKQALRHPNWSMGAKITIDSATMMNKGLEVIEAHWLFDLVPSQIHVLVHPQSIIHSIVTFEDGSSKAQLGPPDMRVPIQYALTYPERWPAPHPRLDWSILRGLDFEPPDLQRFPCLRLAYEALSAGGTSPAVLNAANEEAVALFLSERIGFTDIPRIVGTALERLPDPDGGTLESLEEADLRARTYVHEELKRVRAN